MSDSAQQHEHTHRDVTGGWLRPAVFGAMDGLVSNGALMAGVAGGTSVNGDSRTAVILAGLAGLVAGAFSMAVGEYTSVASQAEMAEREFALERSQLAHNPEIERAELAAVWVSRGVDPDLASAFAEQLARDPEAELEVHAREEIGLAPGELPSPWLAAGASFLSFTVGAVIPVLPYLLGAQVFLWSAILTALALFVAGALASRLTTRSWWYAGSRQLLLGLAAGLVTYAIGRLVGSSLS